MGNGLEIMLDIQQDEYLPIWRETSKPQNFSSNVIPSPAAARDASSRLFYLISATSINFLGSCTTCVAFSDRVPATWFVKGISQRKYRFASDLYFNCHCQITLIHRVYFSNLNEIWLLCCFPSYDAASTISSWRWDVPGGRHPSSDPQSGRAPLHPPAGLWRLPWLPDLCFMSGAEGRSSSSRLPELLCSLQPLTPAGLDRGLINLSVLSWPTCPSPGGTAALPAKRSSQDTTHTASVPVACSARPMRSCECVTVGWCTCLVRSPRNIHSDRAQQVSQEKKTHRLKIHSLTLIRELYMFCGNFTVALAIYIQYIDLYICNKVKNEPSSFIIFMLYLVCVFGLSNCGWACCSTPLHFCSSWAP